MSTDAEVMDMVVRGSAMTKSSRVPKTYSVHLLAYMASGVWTRGGGGICL